MKLNCTIDDVKYSLNVNTDKPLNKILEECLDTFTSNSKCLGANCGNCIVLVNGTCTLSCLVPAFKLNNASILTYEGYSKTRYCHDIERAYAETGISPCRQCYASKTMLIESILKKLIDDKTKAKTTIGPAVKKQMVDSKMIARELSINKCKCLDSNQLEKVIALAYQYRSRRRGKA